MTRSSSRLPVYVTVDVELWPSSWSTHRAEFRDAFERYILGRTSRGVVGLPFQLTLARDYDLRFVFFVESLFACEFGISPLADIVGMIREAGQEVQLHAHPEWIRHSSRPFLDTGSRYAFREFSREEQSVLVARALENLVEAGAENVRAFRAGSFAANLDTVAAVSGAGLGVDSSFKLGARPSGEPARPVDGCFRIGDVVEYPLSVFEDRRGHTRHLQIGSCSWRELAHVVRRARELRWPAVVVLSHSVELLNESRTLPDRIVMRRFERFCRFLSGVADDAPTAWFGDQERAPLALGQMAPIRSSLWRTAWRVGEQALRKLSR